MDKRFVLLLSLMFSLAVTAMAEGINALTLNMASGRQVTYLLEDRPVVTFQGNELVVNTHMNVVSYASDDVLKFTYSKLSKEMVDGIASAKVKGATFSFVDDVLVAANLDPLSHVSVSSVDGKHLASAKADSHGNARIRIPAGSGRVCVIKTTTATFKLRRL